MSIFKELYDVELPELDTIDNTENPTVLTHFSDSIDKYHWYVVAGDELPNGDMELFCLVKLITVELGMCLLSQLHEIGVKKDNDWEPRGMYDIQKELKGDI